MWKRLSLGTLVIAAAGAILYGCDTLSEGGETIFLQPKQVTFRFQFSSESLTVNTSAAIASTGSVDLGPLLSSDGYSKGDVISVRINEAELRRRQPLAVNLGFLRDVQVFVQPPSGNAVSVANLTNVPAANSASLQIVSGRDIAAQVTGTGFNARLQFVPTSLVPQEDYELEVTLELRIEVEG